MDEQIVEVRTASMAIAFIFSGSTLLPPRLNQNTAPDAENERIGSQMEMILVST